MNKFIKQLLDSDKRIAIPIMTHPGIEAIGKKVFDAVTNGEVHYQAIRNVTETYNTAACTVIMDLTVEAEAFGCTISMPEHEVPSVTGRLVYDEESVNRLQVPSLSVGRMPEYLKANRLAIENIKDKPVLSGCIGPFSLAGRLYDMSEIMVGIYIEPDVIKTLLDKCTAYITAYCKELKSLGATGVIMAEPAAGLLSNDDCQEYSTVYVKQIVEAVQDENFTVILHNCGNKGQCTQAMIDSGAAALHFGNAVDMVATLEQCPSDLIVMGNIDPVGILKQASSEDVYRITSDLLAKTAGYKNFVISSGCDMPPLVPEANIKAFYKAVADFNGVK
ncbi:methylcobamide--CoM methyltransferase [Parabacteroides sp. AM58-2XD]|mgnify:FL=1|uniref:uroporphyrinogen decarboxylase family protein n=1 Tax=Parabacteroides TaxID=375288 RepID=UPI000FE272AF|nr:MULTISPECIES: uroporphyrinogen decarboxylase family protein [Parabacteroides]RGZ02880.1 methylcobamide--CoM methyltransferase [Parabacteroides sp. AM58-2XD]GKG73010.1 methylcobamide--CoM methyltransferase [Parabacteroides goldsteinii]GKG78945.1 methylcobamide--CoM methyltransferase [Parabacteroides goldsteinii]